MLNGCWWGLQALEYINEQGGLPIAARYLARAVALPPSNTSWYMGLSNGAAGLCALHPDLQPPSSVTPSHIAVLFASAAVRMPNCTSAGHMVPTITIKPIYNRNMHRLVGLNAVCLVYRRPAGCAGEQPKGGGGCGGDLHGGPGHDCACHPWAAQAGQGPHRPPRLCS